MLGARTSYCRMELEMHELFKLETQAYRGSFLLASISAILESLLKADCLSDCNIKVKDDSTSAQMEV